VAYEDVFRALASHKARYLVAGGVAVNLHGVPRMTVDLDLLVDLSPANARRVVGALSSIGFEPRVPVPFVDFAEAAKRDAWIREKGMMVFSAHHPKRPWEIVDLFVDPPVEFSAAWRRRKRVSIGGVTVPIVSIQDLMAMKRKAAREQDLSDLEALEKLRREMRNGGS